MPLMKNTPHIDHLDVLRRAGQAHLENGNPLTGSLLISTAHRMQQLEDDRKFWKRQTIEFIILSVVLIIAHLISRLP